MISKNDQEMIQRILKERAASLGVTVEDLLKAEPDRPRFLQFAEMKATKLGTSVDEVLDETVGAILASEYPGPDCLLPYQVERYLRSGELSDKASEHLETCTMCDTLLIAAKPREEWVSQFLEEVRILLPRAVAVAALRRQPADTSMSRIENIRPEENLTREEEIAGVYAAASRLFSPLRS